MNNSNASLENRITRFKIPAPVQSIPLENELPFGRGRKIPPITCNEMEAAQAITLLGNNEKSANRMNPLISKNTFNIPLNQKSITQTNQPSSPPLSFIKPQHRPMKEIIFQPPFSVTSTPTTIVNPSDVLYFDASLILFLKREDGGIRSNTHINPTLISSNATGSVSGDRSHFGAILNSGCWLLHSQTALHHPLLPPTANNKLKLLKCAEFMAREWMHFQGTSSMGGLAIARDERAMLSAAPNRLTVTGSGNGLAWAIIQEGQGPVIANQPLPFVYDAREGDWLVLVRLDGANELNFHFWEALKRILQSSSILDDLEERVAGMLPSCCTGMVASRLIKFGEFDRSMAVRIPDDRSLTVRTLGIPDDRSLTVRTLGISHKAHLDTRLGALTSAVEPGRFGSTTRHCTVFRPNYLAALHHDASKINRFAPTIDYILKKLRSLNNANNNSATPKSLTLAAPLDLTRISEIQYWAYVLFLPSGELICSVGGGASIMIVTDLESKLVIDDSIGSKLVIDDPNNTVILAHLQPCKVILLSPHLIGMTRSTQNESFNEFVQRRGIDLHHPKLSYSEFEIK